MQIARILLLLVLFPLNAHAWGAKGHSIVAELAERGLSPAAAAQVRSLNFAAPIRDIASLADDWRGEEVSGVRPGDTGPLHYANIPNDSGGFDRERDCPSDQCIVGAIERYSAVLADRTQSRERRREALVYVVHFLADLHQPMHAASSWIREPDGTRRLDRGGNDIPVRYLGVDTNLHRMWDSQLIEWGPESIDGYVDHLLRYSIRGRPVEELQRGSVVDWINESHYAAVHHAYKIGDGRIGGEYSRENIGVVEERLLRAGLRLRRILEESLGR
jgi:nuclease S1